jgi:hypothetical protein
LLGLKLDTISSRDALPKGKVNVRYEFTADKPGEFGTGGTSRLFINGKQQAEARMEHSVPFRFASYARMDIGTDNGLPVVPKLWYAKLLPKHFQGTIEKVEFDSRSRQSQRRRSPADLSTALCQCSAQLSDREVLQCTIDRFTTQKLGFLSSRSLRVHPPKRDSATRIGFELLITISCKDIRSLVTD